MSAGEGDPGLEKGTPMLFTPLHKAVLPSFWDDFGILVLYVEIDVPSL